MKLIRKTFLTVAISVFAMSLALLVAVMLAAACSDKVTLRFETYGGTPLDAIEGDAGGIILPPDDPEKEGYAFEGWYLDSDFSGEPKILPGTMPQSSTTYYAKFVKYPILTLDTDGGMLPKTEFSVRPGTPLKSFLEGIEPSKRGLEFGGWTSEGTLLPEGAVMPDSDLTLGAKYRARYEFNVYLQCADEPEEFEKSDLYSISGSDWEGTTVGFTLPEIAHFTLDVGKSDSASRYLRAGENTLGFYFTRQEVTLSYDPNPPQGGATGRMSEIKSRYGARVTLSESAYRTAGYVFFGWSRAANAPADDALSPGKNLVLGDEDVTLYASWAKEYPSAKGDGLLVVEECGEKRRAVLIGEDGARREGTFDPEQETFSLENGAGGRLDGLGGYLPDDSGKYLGYSLAENGAGARFGTLTLDFAAGTAVYELEGKAETGEYEYVHDGEKYVGIYRFCADGVSFPFLLNGETFLREGKEKGVFLAYSLLGDEVDPSQTLTLDGFGGAVLKEAGEVHTGSYLGLGGGEWQFVGEGRRIRFRAGTREWTVGDRLLETENCFLVYDPALAGTFASEDGTLSLDGYGFLAVYTSGETQTVGKYTVSGRFVTLSGEETVRFALDPLFGRFHLCGDEAGVYEGEYSLLLDGAGGAELYRADGGFLAAGNYEREEDGWIFLPARNSAVGSFRFRLEEGTYSVRDERFFGEFETFCGPCLLLDGYGGGVYFGTAGESVEIGVVYAAEDLIGVSAPCFGTQTGAFYFRLDFGARSAEQIAKREVGLYRFRDGAGSLFLDGAGGAAWEKDGETFFGTYVYDPAAGKAVCFDGTAETEFLLFSEDASCVPRGIFGVFFTPKGELEADGFGSASYRTADGIVTGSIRWIFGEEGAGGAELTAGTVLYRFEAVGDAWSEPLVFDRYEGLFSLSALYLGRDGSTAFLRGEEDVCGTYSVSDGEILVDCGGEMTVTVGERKEGAFYRVKRGDCAEQSYSCAGGELVAGPFGAEYRTEDKIFLLDVLWEGDGCLVTEGEDGAVRCFLLDGESAEECPSAVAFRLV